MPVVADHICGRPSEAAAGVRRAGFGGRGIWMGTRYTLDQVAKLFRLPVDRLRRLQREGVLPASIEDGRRRYYSFQDLIAVRAYLGLEAQGIDGRRVRRAVEQIRSLLPGVTHPLRELRITSDGDRVVVARSGERPFDGESGQVLLDFDVKAIEEDVVSRLEPGHAPARRADDFFVDACRLEDAGDFDGAEAAFLAALERDAGHVSAIINLGNLRYRRGDGAGARSLYEQAIAMAPDRAEGFYNLGFLQLDEGDARGAVPLLQAAVARDPEFADAYFNLALAYDRLGQADRARDLWRRCVEVDPAGAFADEARERLRGTND